VEQYRAYTIDQGRKRIREIEEAVLTPAVLRIEAEDRGRRLVGFRHRLKTAERLAAKVGHHLRASPDISFEEAFRKVKDAVRYTFCYPDRSYADGVHADCARLRGAGFEPVDLRNSWGTDEYPGINSRWRVTGTGQLFEVQFHTEASYGHRQATHDAYEKLCDRATLKRERDTLADSRRRMGAMVPVPPGAEGIPGYE
jgi:hypothetical protein